MNCAVLIEDVAIFKEHIYVGFESANETVAGNFHSWELNGNLVLPIPLGPNSLLEGWYMVYISIQTGLVTISHYKPVALACYSD